MENKKSKFENRNQVTIDKEIMEGRDRGFGRIHAQKGYFSQWRRSMEVFFEAPIIQNHV
jgi:hypothetical protein